MRAQARQRPRTLRLIVGYKFVRGVGSALLAALLLWFEATGRGSLLHDVAEVARLHSTGAWSTRLAELALKASSEPFATRIALALLLDGGVALLEGFALARGYAWAPLVVALAMAAFVPFEVIALTRHFTAPRVALLVVNVAIVVYLLSRFRAERPD